jgi:hypothetical protein
MLLNPPIFQTLFLFGSSSPHLSIAAQCAAAIGDVDDFATLFHGTRPAETFHGSVSS